MKLRWSMTKTRTMESLGDCFSAEWVSECGRFYFLRRGDGWKIGDHDIDGYRRLLAAGLLDARFPTRRQAITVLEQSLEAAA